MFVHHFTLFSFSDVSSSSWFLLSLFCFCISSLCRISGVSLFYLVGFQVFLTPYSFWCLIVSLLSYCLMIFLHPFILCWLCPLATLMILCCFPTPYSLHFCCFSIRSSSAETLVCFHAFTFFWFAGVFLPLPSMLNFCCPYYPQSFLIIWFFTASSF